ncbi:hypothetical protein ACVWYQ_000967 [Bradyrhizobium sp. USDA 3397]
MGRCEENLRIAKKKSVARIRYVVKYEFDGSPHYGAIQIEDCSGSSEARENFADEWLFSGEVLLNAASIVPFQLKL